jgi:hypothetical protein
MISVQNWCAITRQYSTMDLPLTEQEYETALAVWKAGALIQDAFPTLNAGEREFLKTGMTPNVWDSVFGKDGDNA